MKMSKRFLTLFYLSSLWCGVGLVLIQPGLISFLLGVGMIMLPIGCMVYYLLDRECDRTDRWIRSGFKTELLFGEGYYGDENENS